MNDDHSELRGRFEAAGQGHVFRYWGTLSKAQRGELLTDLAAVDLDRCAPLIETLVRNSDAPHLPEKVEPAPIYPADPGRDRVEEYASARAAGEEAIRAGRVAAFTVAGGQGTRLGFDGPKGAFRISPVRNASLFQLFAEGLRGVERRFGRRPRWYVMTSPSNHVATLAFFEQQAWFGLRPDDVFFFPQAQMPAFHIDGRIALAERHRLALSPDGHGGSFWALARSGALADMRQRGIDVLSYFQVDNPLVRVIDPLFVGLHLGTQSEMSSKAVTKADDLERVGNFCLADGRLSIIEYSDLPEKLARSRFPDGRRRFDAGSIAVHLLSRVFVERLTDPASGVQLPWHRAVKKVAVVDEHGTVSAPAAPNVVKLEMFVFDAIPLAQNPLVLQTPRAEEFSPVKNADGIDSPATARRDMILRAARWLEAAGVRVPRSVEGVPAAVLEISPAFALDAEDLAARGVGSLEILPNAACLLS